LRRLERVVAFAFVLWLAPELVYAQTSPSTPSARYTPLVHGWESFFTITSEPIERRGRPWVAGYILNDYGFAATRVQLLVDGLDDNGRVVSQRVSWLGSSVPPGSRVYFEVPAPEAAARYGVSVFAFDWLQTASVQTP
jgi:hypothetical protein